MLTVRHSGPRIEPDPEHGFQIIFWFGDAFDYSIPFRAALEEIVEILKQSGPVELALPPYVPDEDFVEGTLMFGEASLNVYYEYSLGYFAIMSPDRSLLENLAARVLPRVRVSQ